MKIAFIMFLVLLLPVTPAYGLDCTEMPFAEDRDGVSVFIAKTIKDYHEKVEVEIIECIKGPCTEGNKTIIKKSKWDWPRPETKAGEKWKWAVQLVPAFYLFHTEEYEVLVCTTPLIKAE